MNFVSAGLLLFWGIYFALAGIGNLVDFLTDHGYRGRMFRSSSKNLELIERVVQRHGVSPSKARLLFSVILTWELATAAGYLLSLFFYLEGMGFLLGYSFLVGMAFTGGLILGNEAFVYYEDEEEHFVLLIAQLASYVAVVLL